MENGKLKSNIQITNYNIAYILLSAFSFQHLAFNLRRMNAKTDI